MQQLSHYKVNLHVLSPIHVGTGQELDPFSFVIRGDGLFLIDIVRWMEGYTEKETLERMMESDNFANVRSFIAERFNLENAVRCSIPVDSPKLLATYQKAIRERDPRNQVLINPVMRNELTQEAFIPGSSIKGSIRTAIANRFVEAAGVTSNDSRGRDDYNSKIFGRIDKDPMRYLKISDVTLGKAGTVVVEAKELPLNPDKPLTPKGHMEVACSLSHTGRQYVYPLQLSMAPFDLHGVRVDTTFLIDSLCLFYITKYTEEYLKFYDSGSSDEIKKGIASLSRAVTELKSNEALIRLGHFSHVECVTLDKVRNPKTRMGRDRKPLPWGKTRTLANGLYPFGWAKLEFLDLKAEPRPEKKWPFFLDGADSKDVKFAPDLPTFKSAGLREQVKSRPPSAKGVQEGRPVRAEAQPVEKEPAAAVTLSPLEKLLKELDLIRANDMGRIGTIIQKIEALEKDADRGELASAIRDKIGSKAFKKHNQKEYLVKLIAGAGKSGKG
jgi:CRISPR-associated protein Csm5